MEPLPRHDIPSGERKLVRCANLTADTKQMLFAAGTNVVASTPEEFATTIRDEIALWGKLIREVGNKSG